MLMSAVLVEMSKGHGFSTLLQEGDTTKGFDLAAWFTGYVRLQQVWWAGRACFLGARVGVVVVVVGCSHSCGAAVTSCHRGCEGCAWCGHVRH